MATSAKKKVTTLLLAWAAAETIARRTQPCFKQRLETEATSLHHLPLSDQSV